MKKIILGIVLATFILGGCTSAQTQTTKEKIEQNVVTKVGTISTKSGSDYLLVTSDGIVNITSNKVNLDIWLKKPIRVTGMYSGSTLYVDELESAVAN